MEEVLLFFVVCLCLISDLRYFVMVFCFPPSFSELCFCAGLAVRCDEPVRPDQKNNTLAHEYLDEESVLEEKVEVLADMMRGGKCVVYSGAGLSRASGIPDYGSKAKESLSNTTKKLVTPLDAEPTLSHCVIARLVEKGLVVQVVNQNHDGLAQKAGVPEALVNEIRELAFCLCVCVCGVLF